MGMDFRIEFSCENCGHGWHQFFDEGQRVTEKTPTSMTSVSQNSHRFIGVYDVAGYEDEMITKVDCKNCAVERDVQIEKREPAD